MNLEYIKLHHNKIVIFLLVIFFLQTVISGWDETLTHDGPFYIAGGYEILKSGEFTFPNSLDHPPLTYYLSGWPLFFYDDDYTANLTGFPYTGVAIDIIYSAENPQFVMFLTKLPIMLLFVLLGYFIFLWAKEIYNVEAGLLALVLYSFSPTMIANARVVSSDSPFTVFAFISIYYFWKFIKKSNVFYFSMWTVFTILAFITKITGLYLLPIFFFLGLMTLYKNKLGKGFISFKKFNQKRKNDAATLFLYFSLWTAVILIILPFFYMFEMNTAAEILPDYKLDKFRGIVSDKFPGFADSGFFNFMMNDFRTPWNLYMYTISDNGIIHGLQGHDAFLLGQYSHSGWWYYFPFVFLVKTSLAILGLLAVRFAQFLYNEKKFGDYFLLVSLFFLFVPFMFINVNVGIRHILQAYPFVFVFLSGIMMLGKKNSFKILLIIALVWHVVSSLLIFPYHIAYFNGLVMPGDGYKYLSDGNIDWGQDLRRLSVYLEENDMGHVYIAYFGSGVIDPKLYGINYTLLPPFDDLAEENCREVEGYVAVSVTSLQGTYLKNHNCFDWLIDQEPIAKVGYSIYVYDVSN